MKSPDLSPALLDLIRLLAEIAVAEFVAENSSENQETKGNNDDKTQ
ncbi:MAG: hypothetical protein RPU41_03215 [Candidatus Sedimenticola sp. (ex Thyasira tokunagai)]